MRMEFRLVNTAADEQRIEPHALRTRYIGVDAIADDERAFNRGDGACRYQGLLENRRIGPAQNMSLSPRCTTMSGFAHRNVKLRARKPSSMER